MKKLLILSVLCVAAGPLNAQATCRVVDQAPLRALSAELKRGFSTFKKLNPPVYYLSYTYDDLDEYRLYVSQGGVALERHGQTGTLDVLARVGSVKLDNTRPLKGAYNPVHTERVDVPQLTRQDSAAFRKAVWQATQTMIERAQKDYGQVKTNSQTAAERLDKSDDFVFPPKEVFCRETSPKTFDTARIKELLLTVSKLVDGNPFVQESELSFSVTQGYHYFVDSVGTQLKTPVLFVRLFYTLENQLKDGSRLARSFSYDVADESQLPTLQRLTADVKKSLDELKAVSLAPEADPITAPAILTNRAMAVFVHEVLGHRLEGHRQKLDSFGRTFTSKIGQPITAPFISIVDDATLREFNGIVLRGFYEFDDEGVRARPVKLVENGVLKGFLMSSSPIDGFGASNGHGRKSAGRLPVARMGNTRLIASQTVPYVQLEKQLQQEIIRQQKPYGYIIDDLSGGFTMTDTDFPQVFKLEPKLVYRMYPDGRKEIVRGADMVGTPLVSFGQIIAAADDYAVFNGTCGAESGWVPVSGIAPSVLLKSLEIEKTAKREDKPPLLPAPTVAQGGTK